jgi:uncharacterized membrane protein YqjE
MLNFVHRYRWPLCYAIAAAVAAAMIWSIGMGGEPVGFKTLDGGDVVDLLTPLFVIALFLERAQEVFVSAWREPQRKEAEAHIAALEAVQDAAGARAAGVQLAEYKAQTQRVAFLFRFLVAMAISTVGVRSLEHLVAMPPLDGSVQRTAFTVIDIVLTAAIIGGGSDGIHKLVSVITDFLDSTRQRIQNA